MATTVKTKRGPKRGRLDSVAMASQGRITSNMPRGGIFKRVKLRRT